MLKVQSVSMSRRLQFSVSLPPSLVSLCGGNTWVCVVTADVQHRWSICVTSQTKYPPLTSSGATALLILSLGLVLPPCLEEEWTFLKSREAVGLEGRTSDEEIIAATLDASDCPLGSMTALMTTGK